MTAQVFGLSDVFIGDSSILGKGAGVSRSRRRPAGDSVSGRHEGDIVHIIVTCECCGRRHSLARTVDRPQTLHLVCHDCERCLRVEVTARDMKREVPLGAAPC
jgi:hypothetical protein